MGGAQGSVSQMVNGVGQSQLVQVNITIVTDIDN